MKKGKCIYCKEDKDLNGEHAFPKCLLDDRLRGTKHEWIIDKHLCVECNSYRGKQLDEVLINASPIGFVWNGIQVELGKRTEDRQATFYKNAKSHGIHPVRLFFADPCRDNWIVLHEEKPARSDTEIPVAWVNALSPQIILIQSSKEQTFEEAKTENYEKFNTADSDKKIITKYDEHDEVYYNFGNTFIFPPETTEAFLRKEKNKKNLRPNSSRRVTALIVRLYVFANITCMAHSYPSPILLSSKRKGLWNKRSFPNRSHSGRGDCASSDRATIHLRCPHHAQNHP